MAANAQFLETVTTPEVYLRQKKRQRNGWRFYYAVTITARL